MEKSRNPEEITPRECVGCGYCCMKTPCDAARRLYPNVEHCPQLNWNGERYVCGLMEISGPLGEQYKKELYAGAGCCASLNSWRNDVKKREPELKRTNINPLPETMQMFIRALASEFISSDIIYLALEKFKKDMLKSNYSEEDIQSIIKACVHLFTENKSRFNSQFMG